MWHDGRLPVLAGTAAGLAAAAVLTLLQSSTYRADASIVLVRQGQPPGNDPALAQAAAAAADLFDSRAVAQPATANLRLDDSADELLDRVSVTTEADSSLIRISVEAPSRAEARRTAQELAELSTVLFNDRFRPRTVASVWEPARADEDRVSPKPARNLALGALVGALLGQLLGRLRRREPRPKPRVVSAPPVAVATVVAPTPAPVAAALTVPEPVPAAPEPEPEPEVTGPFVLPRLGEWTIGDVERLLAQEGPQFPEQVDELGWYLDSFRGVAGPRGRLPGGVETIVEDVFADLLTAAGARSEDPSGTP
jgi:capsular polysaccharide biosynthesis protein